jgi:1,4-dihydroxy-2-naphthoyl-CoA hydrolase
MPSYPRNAFDKRAGITVLEVSGDQVRATVDVSEDLLQAFGILHGGVYATVIESAASHGAVAWLAETGRFDEGWVAAGVSNHTDFVRPVRHGRLTAEAVPLQRGQTLQLWRVEVRDEQERLVAHGTVKLANFVPR